MIVENNYFRLDNAIHNGFGVGLVGIHSGGVIIRNNLFSPAPLRLGGNIYLETQDGDIDGVEIYNNTILGYATGGNKGCIRYLNYGNGAIKNITIKNNIIDPQSADAIFIDIPSSVISGWNDGFVCDYNIYGDSHTANPFNWNDIPETYTDWRTLKYGDTNSVVPEYNPGLNATYYPDSATDSCVNVGVNLSATGFADDKDGVLRPQGSAWDLGAYEYDQ